MYCNKCGKPLQDGQMYCSSCGNKVGEINNKPEKRKESVSIAAAMIQRAYTVIALASIAISFFWSAIMQNSDFSDYVGVILLMELCVVGLGFSLLTLNKRYQYNAAKVVILYAILTILEMLFLFLWDFDKASTAGWIEVFYGVITIVVYIRLKHEIEDMNRNDPENNFSKYEHRSQPVPAPYTPAENVVVPEKNVVAEESIVVCPHCKSKNRNNRTECWNCKTKFITEQSDAPYWCLKCGEKGPYGDTCPKCGSQSKVYNRQ